MRKIFILGSLLLLSACKEYVPAPQLTVPPLSERYTKAEKVPDINGLSMGEREKAGVESDIKYNDVGGKYNNLIDLYNCVRVAINERKVPDCK